MTEGQHNKGLGGCQRALRRRSVRPAGVAVLALALVGCGGGEKQGGESATTTAAAAERAAAREAMAQGDAAGAVLLLQRGATLAPREAAVWNDLGLAYGAVGLVDSSRTCFERAVRLEPRRAESHLNLAVLLMRSGVSGRARTEFEQAIECEPGNAFHYWNFAAALADVNKPAPARELLVQALAIDPDNGPAEAEMGRVETMLGQRASALAHFARAESLGVATPTLLTNYGVALVEAGRAQEAEVRLARAVQADSTRAVAWNHLGVARLRQGKVEAAVPPLRQAHRLDPKDEGVRFNLGSALVRLERYQEAVTLLSNPRPQRGDLLGVLGMAQRGARDAGALATLREAADKLPRDPVVLNNYGVALAESGATDRALEVWRRVLEIDPGNATAKSNIEARGGTGR